jgi:hypothetical protein
MLAPPYYSLPRLDALFAHFKAVNNAIGISIMLCNYPGRTGVDMPPDFIERLAGLKQVRYVKGSTGEMPRIAELLRRCGGHRGGRPPVARRVEALRGGAASVSSKPRWRIVHIADLRTLTGLPSVQIVAFFAVELWTSCAKSGNNIGPDRNAEFRNQAGRGNSAQSEIHQDMAVPFTKAAADHFAVVSSIVQTEVNGRVAHPLQSNRRAEVVG